MRKKEENISPIISNVTNAGFEKAELDLLKTALERTHMERLLFATKLYKIQKTLKKGIFTHKAFRSAKS
jgi:hypothetical protein